MVIANQENRKSQTRREVVSRNMEMTALLMNMISGVDVERCKSELLMFCPYGQPGDILWVRETWQHDIKVDIDSSPMKWVPNGKFVYAADGTILSKEEMGKLGVWKPSIHMPKIAARLFLQIKSIRVESLQSISAADAIAEGIEDIKADELPNYFYRRYIPADNGALGTVNPITSYKTLWQLINGVDSWNENPWVWVVEYEKIDKPENWPL